MHKPGWGPLSHLKILQLLPEVLSTFLRTCLMMWTLLMHTFLCTCLTMKSFPGGVSPCTCPRVLLETQSTFQCTSWLYFPDGGLWLLGKDCTCDLVVWMIGDTPIQGDKFVYAFLY